MAFGGVGKSALVARWSDRLSAAGWPGVERAFDWSFYSQGTGERVTSSEPFFAEALRFFGDRDPQAGSLHDRGVRLAGLIRQRRTLLILDGVEPLQYPPGPLSGKLKDAGLAALLRGLAASNPGRWTAYGSQAMKMFFPVPSWPAPPTTGVFAATSTPPRLS